MGKPFLLQLSFAMAVLWMATSNILGQQARDIAGPTATQFGMARLVQYGEMHQVIGMRQHQGRVRLADLMAKPNFYAVGALAGLRGEISIIDGQATVTVVSDQLKACPAAGKPSEQQATMLIGAYVDSWTESAITHDLSDTELDSWIESEIERLGGDAKQPKLFMIVGDFERVDLHVLNGACPVHARIRKLEIPVAERPFEANMKSISGQVVGVFANDAVGNITHPATRTHKHVVYRDPQTGEKLTAHVESLSVKQGSRLKLAVMEP
jgi:alpha-acetolactate decarboxylase